MPLVTRDGIITALSPPLDQTLTTRLVDEFVSLERRYLLNDWEPAELDAGQFSELLALILYHADSGQPDPKRSHADCLKYLEDDRVSHAIVPRHNALHLAAVMRAIYKFRSQRGAVHVSTTYTANHMDARFMLESVRWCMTETLRLFWTKDRDAVAKAIRELLTFDVPCIGRYEDALIVQRTDLTAEEEVLVLLHYAGEAGFTRAELSRHARCSPRSTGRSLQQLVDARQVIEVSDGRHRLTDLGSKRVRESLADKLRLS